MLKKYYAMLPLTLLTLPGCFWQCKKKVEPTQIEAEDIVEISDDGKVAVFDAEGEAFIVTEEPNPFLSEEERAVAPDNQATLWTAEVKCEKDFDTVYFDFGQSVITPAQRKTLKRVAKEFMEDLRNDPSTMIVIEGHACNYAGSAEYNMMLSERRAEEVRKFLVAQGIPADRLTIKGCGFEMPKVKSGNREQQAPNRRTEFKVVRFMELKNTTTT